MLHVTAGGGEGGGERGGGEIIPAPQLPTHSEARRGTRAPGGGLGSGIMFITAGPSRGGGGGGVSDLKDDEEFYLPIYSPPPFIPRGN